MHASIDTGQLHGLLARLSLEHDTIDKTLNTLKKQPFSDQLAMQRLKRRLLAVEEEMNKIKSYILPDIIA